MLKGTGFFNNEIRQEESREFYLKTRFFHVPFLSVYFNVEGSDLNQYLLISTAKEGCI